MSEEVKDRLHAIVAASVALRYLLEFDSDDLRVLPKDIQISINNGVIACDKLATSIVPEARNG